MFGNALGWLISALIVAACIVFLVFVGQQGQVSPPGQVGQNAANWKIEMPVEPVTLAPFMVEATDPVALYRQAIDLFEADEFELKRANSFTATDSAQAQRWSKMIQLIVQAARSSRPAVFGNRLADVINYDPDQQHIESLRTIARMAIRMGLLYGTESKYAEQRQHLEAVLALGCKLYAERLTLAEYMLGTELLGESSLGLANQAKRIGETAREASLKEFNDKRLESFRKQIEPVRAAIMVVDPYPGDIFALAENSGEAMWRVEAILALGRLKFSAERPGDTRGASAAIESLCNHGDPRIRTAARAAKDLTIEQFRKLH